MQVKLALTILSFSGSVKVLATIDDTDTGANIIIEIMTLPFCEPPLV